MRTTKKKGRSWLVVLTFVLPLFIFGAAAQAQDPYGDQFGGGWGDDDEPLDEVIVTGRRRLESYFVTTIYEIEEDWGRQWFIARMNAILELYPDESLNGEDQIDQESIEQACSQDAEVFRTNCLSAASTANYTCTIGGGGVAAFGFVWGILPGVLIEGVVQTSCAVASQTATSACNTAADNQSYPAAPLICTTGGGG